MKISTLFTLLIISSALFGQSPTKLFGDLQVGAGLNAKGIALYHGTAGFNVIMKNNLYLRAGGSFAFGGKLTTPNSQLGYTNVNLRLGFNNDISESFRIVPYLGAGYQSNLVTTRKAEPIVEDLNQISGLVGIEVETRYETENVTSICAPLGVDFHINNGKVGVVIGYYYLLSKYAETGLRLGFTFGKQ